MLVAFFLWVLLVVYSNISADTAQYTAVISKKADTTANNFQLSSLFFFSSLAHAKTKIVAKNHMTARIQPSTKINVVMIH